MDKPRQIQLSCNGLTAKKMVKSALESTDSVLQYHESEDRIIAKTGFNFWSWGEVLFIDFEATDQNEATLIAVYAKEDLGRLDATANPEKVKQDFLSQLDWLRGLSKEELERQFQLSDGNSHPKLVNKKSELYSSRLLFVLWAWVVFIPGIVEGLSLTGSEVTILYSIGIINWIILGGYVYFKYIR